MTSADFPLIYTQRAAVTRGQGLVDFVFACSMTPIKLVLAHLARQANVDKQMSNGGILTFESTEPCP